MAQKHAMGTLLLLGAVFLSLNALAVSARPGELSTAEKSLATSSTAVVTASLPAEPAGGPVAVPVPPPTLDPVMTTAGRMTIVERSCRPLAGCRRAPRLHTAWSPCTKDSKRIPSVGGARVPTGFAGSPLSFRSAPKAYIR